MLAWRSSLPLPGFGVETAAPFGVGPWLLAELLIAGFPEQKMPCKKRHSDPVIRDFNVDMGDNSSWRIRGAL